MAEKSRESVGIEPNQKKRILPLVGPTHKYKSVERFL